MANIYIGVLKYECIYVDLGNKHQGWNWRQWAIPVRSIGKKNLNIIKKGKRSQH